MRNKLLVSVIIIFLNAEKFIREAIESVFAQSYDNWELLLVDDGSTDASTKMAQTYAAESPKRIRYLEHGGHQNRGMSSSRNLGIRHASGDFVAFLDADDVFRPQKLEQQVSILASHPEAAMVYGKTRYWFGWTGHPADSRRDYVQNHGIQGDKLINPPKLLTLFLQGKAAIPCICSVLVRRPILLRISGFEEMFHGLYEDQAFYAKICVEAPVFVSNACWDDYRQHSEASCFVAQKTGQEYFARLFYLKWLAGYLADKELTDTDVWHALERELWLSRHPTWLNPSERTRKLVRRTKKWSLWFGEKILPASFRRF